MEKLAVILGGKGQISNSSQTGTYKMRQKSPVCLFIIFAAIIIIGAAIITLTLI